VILNVDVDVDAPVSVAAGVIGNAPVGVVLPVDSAIPISWVSESTGSDHVRRGVASEDENPERPRD
jgi:hypothetical protein